MPCQKLAGYIRLNPIKAYRTNPMLIIKKFLKRMLMVFFCRVRPISRKLKPRCMKNTNAVLIIIQRLFMVRVRVVSIYYLLFQSESPVFSGANTISLLNGNHEYFSVAHFSSFCRTENSIYGNLHEIVINNNA